MKLITTTQAAEILGVSNRTVSTWLKREILPGFKMGQGKLSEWRIDEETLQKFILSRANRLQRKFDEGKQDKSSTSTKTTGTGDYPLDLPEPRNSAEEIPVYSPGYIIVQDSGKPATATPTSTEELPPGVNLDKEPEDSTSDSLDTLHHLPDGEDTLQCNEGESFSPKKTKDKEPLSIGLFYHLDGDTDTTQTDSNNTPDISDSPHASNLEEIHTPPDGEYTPIIAGKD